MDSALLKRALEIADEAVQLEVSERAAFVAEACNGHDILRREVASLLSYEGDLSIAASAGEESPVELPEHGNAWERYTLNDEIACGGMGSIVRAYDDVLERDVAVKVLLDEHSGNDDLIRRFIEEARICSRLQHPGIAPVYDLGQLPDGRPFFAMKLVRGETLASLLAGRAAPDADLTRFLVIFRQLSQTVAFAHSHHVIHRDLKPANIMVGQFGEVQVMDWGLAKTLDEDNRTDDPELREFRAAFHASDRNGERLSAGRQSPVQTRFGVAMGTPAYMSPEQAMGVRDKRADVFALGAILCEILTGSPPYSGSTPTQVYEKSAVGNTAEAFSRLQGCDCDRDLVELARKCLAAEPEDRCADAGELAREFTDLMAATQSRLRNAELATARAEAIAREERKRRRTTLALAVVTLAAVLLIGGGWITVSRQRARREKELALQQAHTATQIQSAIDDTRELYDRAVAAPLHERDLWIEARAAIGRAESIIETDEVDSRLVSLVETLRASIDFGESERHLMRAIEDARDKVFILSTPERPPADVIRDSLAAAFREHGLHPEASSVGDIALKFSRFSPRVRSGLIAAMDQWLMLSSPENRQNLLETVTALDTDSWRKQWRQAYMAEDQEKLHSMFQDPQLSQQPAWNILNLHESVVLSLPNAKQIEVLQRVQPLHSTDFWLNARLGALILERGNGVDALSYLVAAAAIRPSAPLHSRIGDVLMKVERFDEAIIHYNQAVSLSDGAAVDWEFLGQCYFNVGRYEEAVDAFEKALEKQPDSHFALQVLGDSLRLLGRNDEAIAVLRRGVTIHPDDKWCQIHLALALQAGGQLLEALRVFEPLLDDADNGDYGVRIRQESARFVNVALAALTTSADSTVQLDEETRAYLSQQALRWTEYRFEKGLAGTAESLLSDPQVAVVREEQQLAALPEGERKDWQEFWSRIDEQAVAARVRSEHAIAASSWRTLQPHEMTSTAGAELTMDADGAILASGVNQPNDEYRLVATIVNTQVTALRLEVLADPSLPNHGPGRHETGNFQLAELVIEVADAQSTEPAPVSISRAWASYSWRERPVARTIDGDLRTAWHVWGRLGQSHVAVFTLERPLVVTDSTQLIVKLRHGGDLGPGVGRFRLSVTPDDWLSSVAD